MTENEMRREKKFEWLTTVLDRYPDDILQEAMKRRDLGREPDNGKDIPPAEFAIAWAIEDLEDNLGPSLYGIEEKVGQMAVEIKRLVDLLARKL
jgi:hypothetical protein